MTEKVFYDSTHNALFRCPECHKEKTDNVTGQLLSSVSPTITRTCDCGHIFQASLEWKDSEDTGVVETDASKAVSDAPKSHEAGPEAMQPDELVLEGQVSHEPVSDSPLAIEGVGLAMITCPKCQKEQPQAQECAYCGIIMAKYRGDTPKALDPSETIVLRRPPKKKKNKKLRLACAAASVLILIAAALVGYNTFLRSMTTDEIVAKTERSIALIKHSQGNGSAFLVSPNLLVTNYHVVSEVLPDEIEIYFPAVSEQVRYVKRVVFFDEYRDLAILEVESDQKPLPLSVAGGLKKGEDLIIIGSPGVSNTVLPNSVTRGSLNNELLIDGKRFLQISAAVNPGNSGGPAMNFRGEVVAIITLKASAQEGITFGVPMDEVGAVRYRVARFSDEEKDKVDGFFLANLVYKRLFNHASANLHAMKLYAQGMQLAERNNLPPSDGLDIVRRKIDSGLAKLTDQATLNAMDDSLSVIQSRSDIGSKITTNMVKLRALTEEIRKTTKNPTGDPESYAQNIKRFRSRLYSLSENLEMALVIDW
ncbi:hypothetical protein D3OALGA1CA_5024 [Olavius algarvensis associated proteobacterium Delta 3]|nr:hypothetical protein D3OALGA1CA_5024 [Olavius algarvensis associated proteobacterium Delta 3]